MNAGVALLLVVGALLLILKEHDNEVALKGRFEKARP
jgi:hypothetical protein